MNAYRCMVRLAIGNPSTASGSSDPGGRLAQAIIRPLRLLSVVTPVLLSIFPLFCLPSSSVSLPYFNLTVPMRKW